MLARHISLASAWRRIHLIAAAGDPLPLHRPPRRHCPPSDPCPHLPVCASSRAAWPCSAPRPPPGRILAPLLPHTTGFIADPRHRTPTIAAAIATSAAASPADRSYPGCHLHSTSPRMSSGTSSRTEAR